MLNLFVNVASNNRLGFFHRCCIMLLYNSERHYQGETVYSSDYKGKVSLVYTTLDVEKLVVRQ
jgi:hypothetical protein